MSSVDVRCRLDDFSHFQHAAISRQVLSGVNNVPKMILERVRGGERSQEEEEHASKF